ncbi:MAG: glycosyltransferase family 4 protein [Sedimentisphaerales bacterium]|nr:glycosyltransferase family 4 protein [Sedimentisphaerales bacterium]
MNNTLKIFYISQSSFPSTGAQSVYDMCVSEVFGNRGYDTTLIMKRKFWESPPKEYNGDLYEFFGVQHNFKIKKLFGLPRYTSWFQHKAMKYIGNINSLIFAQSVTTASVALDHGHWVLLDRHGLMPPDQEEMLRRRVNLPKFLGTAVVTETLRKDYVEKIPSLANKIIAIPNGVKGHKYAQAALNTNKNKEKGRSKFVSGYLGSYHRGKGVEVILKVANLCPDITFEMYGGNRRVTRLYNVKERYGITELPVNIAIKGGIPQSQVPQKIATFDIALLPNQEHVYMPNGTDIGNWTSPMKMFEYMASGRPIIASDIPVLREVLKDNYNALLVPPTDYAAWRDAIKTLQSSPELRKQLGEQAQKDALEKFSWENRIITIFEKLNVESKVLGQS